MIAKVNYIRSKNKEVGIIFVPSGIDKSQIVKAQDAILVDDYSGNLLIMLDVSSPAPPPMAAASS